MVIFLVVALLDEVVMDAMGIDEVVEGELTEVNVI